MDRTPTNAGQESVWDYPRPPRLERSARHVEVKLGGETIADSSGAYRVLETSHPPTWYIPREDVRERFVSASGRSGSHCEWKGRARYWDVSAGGLHVPAAAWSYEEPTNQFLSIAGFLSFYPSLTECFVDGERVQAQGGSFYGGWITRDVAGPFKGVAGSWGW